MRCRSSYMLVKSNLNPKKKNNNILKKIYIGIVKSKLKKIINLKLLLKKLKQKRFITFIGIHTKFISIAMFLMLRELNPCKMKSFSMNKM